MMSFAQWGNALYSGEKSYAVIPNRKTFVGLAAAVLVIGFALSFGLLSLALRTLPLGMSYAIWTGIGSVGATLVGMIFYGDSRSMKRILLIALVIVSIAGLKLIS